MNPDDLDTAYSIDYDDVTVTLGDNIWNDPRGTDELDSLNVRLATIEKRLSILVPDSKLLEKYEVLQGLYSQYKAAEALLDGPDPEQMT
tara:strand:+ start:234 stop:500 length:267 start_codon:yes stop_codon:yes gene_type:complete